MARGSGWAVSYRGLKRRWRGFFRGARRVVSGIHRDADGFHPSRRYDTERNVYGSEMRTGVGCCTPYTHFFPASLCTFSFPLSPYFLSSSACFHSPFSLRALFHPLLSSSRNPLVSSCFYFIPLSQFHLLFCLFVHSLSSSFLGPRFHVTRASFVFGYTSILNINRIDFLWSYFLSFRMLFALPNTK